MNARRSIVGTVYLWIVLELAGLAAVGIACLIWVGPSTLFPVDSGSIAIYNDLPQDVTLERLDNGPSKRMLLTAGNTYVARNPGGNHDPLVGKFHYQNAFDQERPDVVLGIAAPDGRRLGQVRLPIPPPFGITHVSVCTSQFSDPPLTIDTRDAKIPRCPPLTNPPDGLYYTDSRNEKTEFGLLIVRTGGLVRDPFYGFVEVVFEDQRTGEQTVRHSPTPSRAGAARIERQLSPYLKGTTLEIATENGSRSKFLLDCFCWLFD